MRKRTKIYAGIIVFLSWNVITYILLVYKQSNKDADEKDALKSHISVLHKRLERQANEHDSLVEQLKEAQKLLENKEKSARKTEQPVHASSKPLPLPVLVLACNRPTVQRNLEQLIKYRTSSEQFPIVVSQDCGDAATEEAIRSFQDKVTYIKQPDRSDILLTKKEMRFRGYFNIARHYKWALNQIFHVFNYSSVIIVEDDLDVSPDFFEYFLATREILHADPTIWCVSAWNDNGKTGMISDDPELLYRTDFFPGLGWMLEKNVWLELEDKWPRTFWDDWMRHPDQRKDRSCIRPEISRTSTFGRQGVSRGQFFDKHLKFIQHNTKFVPFTKLDLSYLLQENYDEPFVRLAFGSPIMTVSQLLANDQLHLQTVRLLYKNKESFKAQAKLLGIMDDYKAGIPRCAYHGIVSFVYRGRRVYLVPPSDWTGYDANSWN